MGKKLGIIGLAVVIVLAGGYFWTNRSGGGSTPALRPVPKRDSTSADSVPQMGSESSADQVALKPVPGQATRSGEGEIGDRVFAEGIDEVVSTVDPATVQLMQSMAAARAAGSLAPVTVDYPLNESIFPPDFVPPAFQWHDGAPEADTWLLEFAFADGSERLFVLTPGAPPPAGDIDSRCITSTNEIYQPTAYEASARSWTPSGSVWEAIKKRSVERSVTVTFGGFRSLEPSKPLSQGQVSLVTSHDPVGAPIFYRDVPLAPSSTKEGTIKPLSDAFLPLIAWRLRDVSKPESRLLMTGLLTCTNCHSFSADGQTMGMDLDGPANDKGAYVIAPLAKEAVIDKEHVISWNSFPDKPKDRNTLGFLSRISPDGQYAVTTLNESVYVYNFTDYRFLQVFYPTRGILGYYRRATGEMKALPGADDSEYVHCDPVWGPDGDYLVFARAKARDPYPEGYRPAQHANDPNETQMQYDLYRMRFDEGRGGTPEPILGASGNGMSNNFPKVSPDGKWIVFVKCRNGQLMRPDSQLWIVPAAGGEARLMSANKSRMNSWHSFSPNSRWMVFSSKANTPYTQMFLTHIDDEGNDSPAILIPNSTAANRAVNLPEFINRPYDQLTRIDVPAVQYLNDGMRGIELFEKGKFDEAMVWFQRAVGDQPDYLEGHVSIAVILIEKGQLDAAVPHLEKALALDAKCWFAHANLGIILQRKGKLDEAIAHFARATELQPKNVTARANLGRALAERGRLADATVHFRAAVELASEDAGSRLNLGNALLEQGSAKEAAVHFAKAVELAPRDVDARLGLAEALAACGEFESALAQFRSAYQGNPSDLRAVNELAWILATCPDDRLRDGTTAVRLSDGACQATGYQDPMLLRTLAASYAEAGQWPEAVTAGTRALGLLEPANPPLAQEVREQLERYRRQQPIRSVPGMQQ